MTTIHSGPSPTFLTPQTKQDWSQRVKRFVREFYPGTNLNNPNIAIPCPFHGDAPTKRRLYINPKNGLWICFRCGEKGSFPKFIYKLVKDDPTLNPLEWLAESVYAPIEPETASPVVLDPVREEECPLPDDFFRVNTTPTLEGPFANLNADYVAMNRKALIYLNSRGVDPKMDMRYGFGYCTRGKYADRVVIPVEAVNGVRVGWIARDMSGTHPVKVLTPSGSKIKNHLFGLRQAIEDGHRRVVLVEGVFDAIRHGTSFLALLGKMISAGQTAQLIRYRNQFDRVTVLLDADATHDGALLVSQLKDFLKNKIDLIDCKALGWKDPGEVPVDVMRGALG